MWSEGSQGKSHFSSILQVACFDEPDAIYAWSFACISPLVHTTTLWGLGLSPQPSGITGSQSYQAAELKFKPRPVRALSRTLSPPEPQASQPEPQASGFIFCHQPSPFVPLFASCFFFKLTPFSHQIYFQREILLLK